MRRLEGNVLLVATHNTGKLEEFRALLAPHRIMVQGSADHGLVEPTETEETYLGNARLKAHTAAITTGLPALADDSGIEVEALGGKPGVRTADWAETPNGRDFLVAMTKTHDLLEEEGASHPRVASFCATLVLAWPDGQDAAFVGRVNGHLIWPPRGREGHGYDPIFVPDGHDRTFGEMSWDEKNRLSHRYKALKKFIEAVIA